MLEKLKKPLSFMGEDRVRYAYLDGTWVDLDSLKDAPEGSKTIPMLRERLAEIIVLLSENIPDRDRARDLYLEGQSIKRALHHLKKGGPLMEEYDERKTDLRRWVDYTRKIS